ncbi:MAG: hypothetical protein QNK04_14385 [Myxococcota bacterium]|nr:hypothetical protein [Myxococcota bacterium]
MSRYQELRRKHTDQMLTEMPDYVARLSWPPAQIEVHRRRALRLLLRVAKEYSDWYRDRLRDIDPGTATEADLVRVPPMTRADLMENWDEIVIYPSLRLDLVEKHLRDGNEDAYLYDSFHAVDTTGRDGQRGVFVYDWDGWIASFVGSARWRLRNRGRVLEKVRPVVASVYGTAGSHIQPAIHKTFSVGGFHCLSTRQPFEVLVESLNAVQPHVLLGRPSVFLDLAREARAGRLRIRPPYVTSSGEPLEPDVRSAIEDAFDAHVHDAWIASEALPLGASCSSGAGLHVSDDLLILEPVDDRGAPVKPGRRSDKVYLTNLFNLALPLIRYELDDQVTMASAPCPCGSPYTLVESVRRRPRAGRPARSEQPRVAGAVSAVS